MTNNEFVAIVATKIGENKARTSDIIKKITEAISEELVKGNEIKLNQFGKFSTVRVKSRNGINPSTKEPIVIPELTRAKFKPATILKESLNS